MITPLPALIFAPLASVAVLSACTPTPGAERILAQPEDVQLQAHLKCQALFGIDGVDAIEILRLKDGRSVVSTINGPGVTLTQARAINQCANERLSSGSSTVSSAVVLGAGGTSQPVLQEPVVQATVQQAPVSEGLIGCSRGAGVLQGGVGYCSGY